MGWSRETLAFHSGMSWSAIAQVESGRRTNIRPTTLRRLARALGVTIDYLVDGGPLPAKMLRHQLLTYREDEHFGAAVGSFLAEGLEKSEAVLAVTTRPHAALLQRQLGRDAKRVQFADAGDWYSTPVASFRAYTAYVDDRISEGDSWIRIFGEAMWGGRSDAEIGVWAHYESLVNLAFEAYPVSVLCSYDEGSLEPEIVAAAHQTHPEIVAEGKTAENSSYREPGELVLEVEPE